MDISEEQQLIEKSQLILKQILSQSEIENLKYFTDVFYGQGENLTTEEKKSLEAFFENAVNNQDLNKKISQAIKSLPPEATEMLGILGQVRSFCYKTRFTDNIDGINKKVIRNLELLENNKNIKDSEKIHLSEIGMLSDTYRYQNIINSLDQHNIITPGGVLDKIKSESSLSHTLLQRLNQKIDSAMDVQSGDVYFTHTNKQNAFMNRDPKSFFEKAKNHITKYQHASTLYKRSDDTILGMYETYINQIDNYINYAQNLRNMHMEDFLSLHRYGQLNNEIITALNQFDEENNAPLNALREKISNYREIAQGEVVTPKDFENILKEMQPLVDNAYRQNNDSRAMDFYWTVISNTPNLYGEALNNTFYTMAEHTKNLVEEQGALLYDLYNLNNITTSLDRPRISHINAQYEQYDLSTQEAIMSNQYRVDPIKLIESPETKQALQKKLGDNWEEQIRNQFSEIASVIHGNTNFNITNNQDRMVSAGLADYGLASNPENAEPKMGIKGKAAKWAISKFKTDIGAVKLGNEGHKTNEIEDNKFQKLRDRVLGKNGAETSKNMICSEFAAKTSLTAIVELGDWIKKETGLEKTLDTPIDNKEELSRVHPQRLLELLENSGCITEIKNPVLEKLVNMDVHKRNFYVQENSTELLYDRVKTLASKTRNNPEKFIEEASVIFKAYMKAANPEHNISDQEINNMLKPELVDLQAIYNIKNPEKFLEKLKHLTTTIKEFFGKKLGYEYKSMKTGVASILKTPIIQETAKKIDQINSIKTEVKESLKGMSVNEYVVTEDLQDKEKETAVKKYVTSRKPSTIKQKEDPLKRKKETAVEKYASSKNPSKINKRGDI